MSETTLQKFNRATGAFEVVSAHPESEERLLSDVEPFLRMRVAQADHDRLEVLCDDVTALLDEVQRLRASLVEATRDSKRVNWLESQAVESNRVEIGFTEAWTESGEYGTVLSSGPREFYLSDNEGDCGPTLRKAIDAATASLHTDTP